MLRALGTGDQLFVGRRKAPINAEDKLWGIPGAEQGAGNHWDEEEEEGGQGFLGGVGRRIHPHSGAITKSWKGLHGAPAEQQGFLEDEAEDGTARELLCRDKAPFQCPRLLFALGPGADASPAASWRVLCGFGRARMSGSVGKACPCSPVMPR